MQVKMIALAAALVLLAACSTPSDEATESGAGGSGAGGAGGAGSFTGDEVTAGELPPIQAEQKLVEIGDRVFFGLDQYDLSPEARATIEQQAKFLSQQPALNVVIEGHADERGTREHNLALGDRRANAVRDYLIALGISPERITTVSYGEERPAVVGSNEAAWAQNRRAVTVIVGSEAGS
ncbi:MAG: peptidoglycan-associated lipoprotein Pal [Rhodospirillales bacterium]|nr:peptidoglycan-associated lipoprotein Pal [Rhodospirillales bacterium]